MHLRRAAAGALSLAIAVVAAGCTGQDAASPTTGMTSMITTAGPASSARPVASNGSGVSTDQPVSGAPNEVAVPAEVVEQIHTTINAVNATAGTSPAQQRAVLQDVVDPAHSEQQQSCEDATTTVRFEPAWNDLRPTPGETDSYQLPALIRVYTGDRITRTDVTSLTVTVSAGEAHLPPICVA